jgi:hypothetical protein
MGRYNIDKVETDEDDHIFDGGGQRYHKRSADQPKRSPIRRKNKLRQDEWMKPEAKINYKKVQHRIKHEWQEE